MKKTNREKIEEVLSKEGYVIGCWNKDMELLTQKELKKVLDNACDETDTDVMIKRKPHVVEIDTVDGEVDFSILTKAEYISRYGNERYERED